MSNGAPTNQLLLFILEWVWVPMTTAMVILFRRLFTAEKKQVRDNERIEHVEAELVKMDNNNSEAHQRIEDKIDRHNDRVMRRIDRLIELIRNGHGPQ